MIKTIHRFWTGDPRRYAPRYAQWWEKAQELNPDFEFITWSDCLTGDDVRNPLDYEIGREIFKTTEHVAARSDLFRLAALHAHGGLYVDCDFEILKPLTEVESIFDQHSATFGKDHGGTPQNCACYSEKGSPTISYIFGGLIENSRNWRPRQSVHHVTGPAAVTKLLKNAPEELDWGIFPSSMFLTEDLPKYYNYGAQGVVNASSLKAEVDTSNLYGVHHMSGSWTGISNKRLGL